MGGRERRSTGSSSGGGVAAAGDASAVVPRSPVGLRPAAEPFGMSRSESERPTSTRFDSPRCPRRCMNASNSPPKHGSQAPGVRADRGGSTGVRGRNGEVEQ